MKYIKEDTSVVFSELPDEITLALNITNCPHNCPGCHSSYLRKNIGDELTTDVLDELIEKNDGITCVLFMGEGKDLNGILSLGLHAKTKGLKIGIYSGSNELDERFWSIFNYIKLGPYIEMFGPLNSETTNQRLYKYDGELFSTDIINGKKEHFGWRDITERFWKH